jgi:hypothetical protein
MEQQVSPELNPQQALNVLVQAVKIAQSKGAYTLEDAEVIAKAVKVFAVAETPAEGTAETPAAATDAAPEAKAPAKKLKKA